MPTNTIHAASENHKPKLIPGVVTILAFILASINIIRIIKVPITHDEGLSYLELVKKPVSEIVKMHQASANNHILNTLLAKFFTSIFADTLFFLRIDNLIAQVFYMLFCYLVLDQIVNKKAYVLAGFILLNFNPFLFDFWGLCRGYGLSLCFMMGSIYFLIRYLRKHKTGFLLSSLFFSIYSVYSNFALLNFYLALVCILFFEVLTRSIQPKSFLRKELPAIAISIAVIAILIGGPLYFLRADNQLYYGGDTGFIRDTIGTLIADSIFKDWTGEMAILISCYIVVASVALVAGLLLTKAIGRKVNGDVDFARCFLLLLLLPAIFTVLQHYVLGTKYLISRTALFLVPLYFLCIFSASTLTKAQWQKLVLMPTCLLITLNFIAKVNIQQAWSWKYDKYDAIVMTMLANRAKKTKAKVSIRPYYFWAPSFQYYSQTVFPNIFYPVPHIKEPIGQDTSSDYCFTFAKDIGDLSAVYEKDTIFDGSYALMKKKSVDH
jgi:hypothetical protein